MNQPDPRPSPAAERMRRHRERRRQGLRCVLVEMQQSELDELIRRGLLNNETRNDTDAIRGAIYKFFDNTLGATP
jgi:hypothetical protein